MKGLEIWVCIAMTMGVTVILSKYVSFSTLVTIYLLTFFISPFIIKLLTLKSNKTSEVKNGK